MNAWPSVSIKRGSTITSRKVVKCEWSDTLGEIVERVDRSYCLSHEVVEKVIVSSNAVHEFPLDGPGNRKLIMFSNLPTYPNILSGIKLLQLKWPNRQSSQVTLVGSII